MEVFKILASAVPANTNITGLTPFQGLDFLSEQVKIVVGIEQFKGLAPGPNIDVYPGVNPSSGDLKFTRALAAGEIIQMSTFVPGEVLLGVAAPQYNPNTQTLEVWVWMERNGRRITDPLNAQLKLFLDGSLVHDFGTNTVSDPRGMFKFTRVGIDLVKGRNFVLDAALLIDPPGTSQAFNRTFVNF